MKNKYINPEHKQVHQVTKRGGALDRMRVRFRCQKCAKEVTLTGRQLYSMKQPICTNCGPAATFEKLPFQAKPHRDE